MKSTDLPDNLARTTHNTRFSLVTLRFALVFVSFCIRIQPGLPVSKYANIIFHLLSLTIPTSIGRV